MKRESKKSKCDLAVDTLDGVVRVDVREVVKCKHDWLYIVKNLDRWCQECGRYEAYHYDSRRWREMKPRRA